MHADDTWPWMPTNQQPGVVGHGGSRVLACRDDFIPARIYCVETICAPCGIVVTRPDYICIGKACLVLRTSIANGSWEQMWSKTSRFIVDSYHYTNHSTYDDLHMSQMV
jgi:hypothetical protein